LLLKHFRNVWQIIANFVPANLFVNFVPHNQSTCFLHIKLAIKEEKWTNWTRSSIDVF